MNHNLKSKLGGLLFFEFDDFNCLEFNVIKHSDGQFNLIMDVGFVNTEDEEFPYEYGYSTVTTLFADTLMEMAKLVDTFLKLGMFDHLVFLPEAVCLDSNGEVEFNFTWDDYFSSDSSVLN